MTGVLKWKGRINLVFSLLQLAAITPAAAAKALKTSQNDDGSKVGYVNRVDVGRGKCAIRK